jgi:hypothetical protein
LNWRLRSPACGLGEDASVMVLRLFTFERQDCRRFWRRIGLARRVWPLISQVAFVHDPATLFSAPPAPVKLTRLACSRFLPETGVRFVSPFSAFNRLLSFRKAARTLASCWYSVATVCPLGNCDSPGLETRPGYLTQLGAVSNRSSSLSSFFALTDSARTPPEELVNYASCPRPHGRSSEGLGPTSLAQPFPSCLGLSRRFSHD